jgi:hypothetical protein
MPVQAAVAAADHVWGRSFPFRARRRLRGFELVATDAPWRAGVGVRVEGPMSALLLLVSGRAASLTDLTGPGAADLLGRSRATPARRRPSTTMDASNSSPT